MTWIVTIITWLLSYFLSRKAGAKKGTAALIATGVTAGAYYSGAVDYLANGATSLVSGGKVSTAGSSTSSTAGDVGKIASGSTGWGTVGTIATSALDNTSKVLREWGPVGTAGVIATTTAVTGGRNKTWMWLGLGAGVLLLLRK